MGKIPNRVSRRGLRPGSRVEAIPTEAADPMDALAELVRAAEAFVNKAPQQQRLAMERQALLDAVTRAQLIVSLSNNRRRTF